MIMNQVCTRCLRFLLLPGQSRCRSRSQSRRFASCAVNKKVKKEKVIVISGPTGAGKSRLALELAKRLNGEIISADSVQVYRGLDVGSAKPSPSEREEVPHHLIDILDPSEDYSVGQFFEDARQATKDILESNRIPIVAGGTGLYLRWYIYGKPDVPIASPEIAAEVYSELAELQRNDDWDAAVQLVVKAGDPKAQLLPSNNWYRLRRSLEIIKASGSPPSAFQVPYNSYKVKIDTNLADSSHVVKSGNVLESEDLDYEFICFFLSNRRLDLYRSIDYRCEDMISGNYGLLSEAKLLLDKRLLPNTNSATRAIGYRQAMEYLLRCRQRGGSSVGDFYSFLSEFQKASRDSLSDKQVMIFENKSKVTSTDGRFTNFAKRQMTWYRNEHIYNWLDASKPLDEVLNFIYDAYHDQTGTLVVPESLGMKKELSNQREIIQLKAYRPKNRHFVNRNDCSTILDWIRDTQGEVMSMV